MRRRIRQSGFAYASPLAHAYALRGIVLIAMLAGLLLFLPLPLPAIGVPVVGALMAAFACVAVADAQKRLLNGSVGWKGGIQWFAPRWKGRNSDIQLCREQ